VDGKQIIQGFGSKYGDVDLYDHETKPTLVDRRKRLNTETEAVSSLETKLDVHQDDVDRTVNAIPESQSKEITSEISKTIVNLSTRLRELRRTKLKKDNTLMRLNESVGHN